MEPSAFRTACRLGLVPALLGAALAGARADEGARDIGAALRELAQAHAREKTTAAAGSPAPRFTRVEVNVGELDSRLKLAPCTRMEPYLPAGLRPWGRTRIGVRCLEGPTRWNVFLPVTVRVFAEAWVARSPLAAGAILQPDDLQRGEADLAASLSPTVTDAAAVVGRALARPLNEGEALKLSDLRPKLWFAPGDTVKVVAIGAGFTVHGEGRAMSPGLEGQPVRIRTDSGRIITGFASAERTVEVPL
ncbi:flagellar basal body P-ring formation chaperone FlgA [Aquabacterium sp. A7-Y]|uniref:flagellar basal body P-ring formation chaperone FlgA n=1 Tax=Aquabacterium sp. A7-Y TaxID=1349605 RepID=UPI00223DBAF8|nr:flagellar basal body P-ring formation chaperone FlgA [Aquabacterium sp. A7-Y]MCW7540516.1 flagellar basal body P-ring formation chaperone FlgA [Aquabacterium sp. A7-Y]